MYDEITVKRFSCRCDSCEHSWITRTYSFPKTCPNCKNAYWNKSNALSKATKHIFDENVLNMSDGAKSDTIKTKK
jgi:Zn finger protein HypA/HybF involved in hydrogenase expression